MAIDHNFLNFTKDGYVDYTYIDVEDPPVFLPFEFEKFDYLSTIIYINRNPYIPFFAVVPYIVLIFGIQKLMKNREAFQLKKALFLWNGIIGVLSIFAFVRCLPELVDQVSRFGIHDSLCVRRGGNVPILFWSRFFIYSKFLELGDTMFIVLRKRPLTFLQWSHHSLTVLGTWLTAPYVEPISRFYLIMNLGVHSLMYPYFSFKALNVNIPQKVANVITTLQLTQMLVGLFINIYTAIFYSLSYPCHRHPNSLKMAGTIYGFFAIIFGRLYYYQIVARKTKKKVE